MAIKLLPDASPLGARRLEREARVLASLGIQGVVPFLDHGDEGGTPYIVTELVAGSAFPGPVNLSNWDELAPVALRTLGIVAAFHERDVLHRDLKPANILVDANHAVTVLDFGLARLRETDEDLTRTGDILGTARYQAPEQILADGPVDARADIYAIGLMLYECLAGRPPQPADSLGRTYAARLTMRPTSLRETAPHLPTMVADVIDRMIELRPEHRPGTATEVLLSLTALAPLRSPGELPWLGGDALRDRAIELLRAGTSVAVAGLRGSGRSRFLKRIEKALEGSRSITLEYGEHPYESLAIALRVQPTSAEHANQLVEDVDFAFADDSDQLDPWSVDLMRARNIPTVWVTSEATAWPVLVTEPLTVDALTRLFPPSDAMVERWATVLFQRTDGLAARVAAEVASWIVARHAHWRGETLVLTPEAIHIIEEGPAPDLRVGRRFQPELPPALAETLAWIGYAGPTTVADLAQTSKRPASQINAEVQQLRKSALLAPSEALSTRPDVSLAAERAYGPLVIEALAACRPARARTSLFYSCADWQGAIDNARSVAEELLEQRQAGPAWGHVVWGLRASRASGTRDPGLVRTATVLCTILGTPTSVAMLATEHADPDSVLDGAVRAFREEQLFSRLLDDDLSLARQLVESSQEPARQIREARLLLAQDRAAAALALLERALSGAVTWSEAANIRLLRAEAKLETGFFADAEEDARTLEALGFQCGVPRIALHARAIARDSAVRAGGGRAVERALLEAADCSGIGPLIARVYLTEAGVAWRECRFDEAHRLATRTATVAGGSAALLARALLLGADARPATEQCEALLAAADARQNPTLALQVRGLIAATSPRLAERLIGEAESIASQLESPDEARTVMSGREALAFVRAGMRKGRAPPPGVS